MAPFHFARIPLYIISDFNISWTSIQHSPTFDPYVRMSGESAFCSVFPQNTLRSLYLPCLFSPSPPHVSTRPSSCKATTFCFPGYPTITILMRGRWISSNYRSHSPSTLPHPVYKYPSTRKEREPEGVPAATERWECHVGGERWRTPRNGFQFCM